MMSNSEENQPCKMASRRAAGYTYYVSDEQLDRFAKLTVYQRLQWLDDARILTLMVETPETRERRERLRQGLTIV